jgi:hypothetical protein
MEIRRIWYETASQDRPGIADRKYVCVELAARGVIVCVRSAGVELGDNADLFLETEAAELLSALGSMGACPVSIASALHKLDQTQRAASPRALAPFGFSQPVSV